MKQKTLNAYDTAILLKEGSISPPIDCTDIVTFENGHVLFYKNTKEGLYLCTTLINDKGCVEYFNWNKSSFKNFKGLSETIPVKSIENIKPFVDENEDKFTINYIQALIALKNGIKVFYKDRYDGNFYQVGLNWSIENLIEGDKIFKLEQKTVQVDQSWEELFDSNNELIK